MTLTGRVPSAMDLILALGTGAATIAALIAAPSLLGPGESPSAGGADWWATAVALAAQALVLSAARRAPRSVLAVTPVIAMLLGVFSPTGIGNLADAAVLVAVVRAAPLAAPRHLRVLLPVAGLFVAVGQSADILGSSGLPILPAIGSGVLQAVAIVGLPAVGVLAVAARREAQQARLGESAAMGRERDAVIRAAVAQERTGMARELHDIAAHHVSSIALMAAAIERQIDTDPEQAKRSVRQVRQQSRSLLDDLRRLVGLLRDDAADADAVEDIATIPSMVATLRGTGLAVELRQEGDATGVGPLAQLVVHRMVQQALANAAQHAPGAACAVDLDGSQHHRFIATVRNAPTIDRPTAGSGGFGLLGMRERADLVGGTLEAGPDHDGGWTVRLTVPAERRTTLQQED